MAMMSQAPKAFDTFLNIVFSEDFDRQKAYQVARSISSEKHVIFNGVITVQLPTFPTSFGDAISFTINESQINEVSDAFISSFGVDKKKVRISMTPTPTNMPAPPTTNIFR